MMERPMREPSDRLAGQGRQIHVAGALALTEPGPAAAGVVVTDERGRMLAHRALYLGQTTRAEAVAQALMLGLRLAVDGQIEAPAIRLDDRDAVEALRAGRALSGLPAGLATAIDDLLTQLPGYRVEQVSAIGNLARPVALAPLIDWLPERARRAEDLAVRRIDDRTYEVESESQPGQVYRIAVGSNGDHDPTCQCADFEYRGIPCKHLLAVAREAGGLERLFYRAPRPTAGAREER